MGVDETLNQPRLILADYVVQDAAAGPAGVLRTGALYIEGGRIAAVGPQDQLRAMYPQASVLGGRGRLAIPGLVNAHSHGRGLSTLQQGIPDDALELWLVSLPLLKPLDPYWNTLHSAAQLLRSGVTTVIHSHVGGGAFEAYRRGVERAIQAYEEAGMRVAFAMGYKEYHNLVFDDDETFLATLDPSLRARVQQYLLSRPNISPDDYFHLFDELYPRYQGPDHPRTRLFLSPVGPQWCSDAFMRGVAQRSTTTETGIHIHVSESLYEKWYGPREWDAPVVAHLDSLGLVTPRLSLVHSVWLSEEEIRTCANSGAIVVTNPSSNLRLHNGIAPLNQMWAAGLTVALGIDSTALDDDEDMLREMRLAMNLHRNPGVAAVVPDAYKILEMATRGGARATLLEDEIGTLEVGKQADVVLVNLERISRPYLDPSLDVVEAFLTRGRAEDVETVLIDGRVVLKEGQYPHLDLHEIEAQQRDAAQSGDAHREETLRRLLADLRPALVRFYQDWEESTALDPYYTLNSRR
ncbi:MAG: amidohydrolase family protein [Dehalococcoidia bacterium]